MEQSTLEELSLSIYLGDTAEAVKQELSLANIVLKRMSGIRKIRFHAAGARIRMTAISALAVDLDLRFHYHGGQDYDHLTGGCAQGAFFTFSGVLDRYNPQPVNYSSRNNTTIQPISLKPSAGHLYCRPSGLPAAQNFNKLSASKLDRLPNEILGMILSHTGLTTSNGMYNGVDTRRIRDARGVQIAEVDGKAVARPLVIDCCGTCNNGLNWCMCTRIGQFSSTCTCNNLPNAIFRINTRIHCLATNHFFRSNQFYVTGSVAEIARTVALIPDERMRIIPSICIDLGFQVANGPFDFCSQLRRSEDFVARNIDLKALVDPILARSTRPDFVMKVLCTFELSHPRSPHPEECLHEFQSQLKSLGYGDQVKLITNIFWTLENPKQRMEPMASVRLYRLLQKRMWEFDDDENDFTRGKLFWNDWGYRLSPGLIDGDERAPYVEREPLDPRTVERSEFERMYHPADTSTLFKSSRSDAARMDFC